MVAPGTRHRAPGIIQAPARHLASLKLLRHDNGAHWGASAVSRRRKPNWRCQQAWSQAQVPSQVLPIDMATHRNASTSHLATAAVRGTGTGNLLWGVAAIWTWPGRAAGSRSCAISNWNLSFMWPEARVVGRVSEVIAWKPNLEPVSVQGTRNGVYLRSLQRLRF